MHSDEVIEKNKTQLFHRNKTINNKSFFGLSLEEKIMERQILNKSCQF